MLTVITCSLHTIKLKLNACSALRSIAKYICLPLPGDVIAHPQLHGGNFGELPYVRRPLMRFSTYRLASSHTSGAAFPTHYRKCYGVIQLPCAQMGLLRVAVTSRTKRQFLMRENKNKNKEKIEVFSEDIPRAVL